MFSRPFLLATAPGGATTHHDRLRSSHAFLVSLLRQGHVVASRRVAAYLGSCVYPSSVCPGSSMMRDCPCSGIFVGTRRLPVPPSVARGSVFLCRPHPQFILTPVYIYRYI